VLRIRLMSLMSRIPFISAGLAAHTRASNMKTAEAIAADARQRVPVLTGNLRDSIHVEPEGVDAWVLTKVHYANFVEFGTRHAPPYPFMTPAAEAHGQGHAERMGNSLRAFIS
jgi:HK97 gp10 family phage protein